MTTCVIPLDIYVNSYLYIVTANGHDTDKMHKRGWIRKSPRFAPGPQREALRANGVEDKNIYEGDIEAFIKSLRKGDAAVVDGLHRLATSWSKLEDVMGQLKAKGVFVGDARSGEVVTAASLTLTTEARRVYAGEARIPTHDEASRRGKLGGKPETKHTLSKAQMRVIWFDKSIETNADAAKKCDAQIRTMYRYFGKSGRPAGWKRKASR